MTTASTQTLSSSVRATTGLREWLSVYSELTKARLSFFVVITTIVGYAMAAIGPFDWLALSLTAIGTALAAGSANAFNQWLEIERDRLMPRTAGRPLPSGRISPAHALCFAILTGATGVAILAIGVNLLSATLALATIVLYVVIYTPLKTMTTLNTLIGAIVGAVPPMIGWAGATGSLSIGAWVLAAILFTWQMPHFLALAWMYRHQYELGGYRMLPAADPSGRLTAMASLLYAVALLAVTLLATLLGLTGWIYAGGALLLGLWTIHGAWAMLRHRSDEKAKRLFLSSVLYLPLLMGLLVIDKRMPPPQPQAPLAGHVDDTGGSGPQDAVQDSW